MWHDLQLAVRLLRRQPGFTAAVAGILGFGLAANTAIYSVAQATVLRPSPFPGRDRLVAVENFSLQKSGPYPVKAADYLELRARNRSFEEVALFRRGESFNVFHADRPERIVGTVNTASFFRVLGVRPQLGRVFRDEDEQAGRVVVLSDAFWKAMFSSDRAILGKPLLLNGEPFEIIGVMPPEFDYPAPEVRVWTPLVYDPQELKARFLHRFAVIGRLKPGVPLAEAAREVTALGQSLRAEFPVLNQDIGMRLSEFEAPAVQTLRQLLFLLGAASGLLLLLICANLANLMLARGLDRTREMNIRFALGASRFSLLRQSAVECVLLAIPACLLGLAAAYLALGPVLRMAPNTIPGLDAVTLDLRVAFLTFALGIGTALIFGLAPACVVTPGTGLRERGRSGSIPRLARKLLVAGQIGLCVFLLIGTGLLFRTLENLVAIGAGLRTDNLLAMRLMLPKNRYPNDESANRFFAQLREKAAALPGVASAVLINRMPLDGTLLSGPVQVPGREKQIPDHADHRTVSPEWFATVGIPLREGRLFTPADNETSPHVVIVDEIVAKRYFPGESAVGKRIQPGSPQLKLPHAEIIGVVGTVRMDGPDRPVRGQVYAPFVQRAGNDRMTLVVKGTGNPEPLVPAIRAAVAELDPRQPVFGVQTLESLFDQTIWQRKLALLLAGVFGLAAVLLSAAGLYAVMEFTVSRRKREIGIRMALGAAASRVLAQFLSEGIGLAVAGAGAGVLVASAAASWIEAHVYGISPRDPMTMIGAIVLVLAIALAAVIGPAKAAAAIDPAEHLREI